MNILITRFPYESALGGEEMHTINLAKFLRREGHQVSFAGSCTVLLSEFKKDQFTTYKVWGSKMPVTPYQLLKFIIIWPFIFLTFYKRFTLIFKKENTNVLYCLSLTEKILLTPIAFKKNIKVVWVEHQYIKKWLTSSPLQYLYKYLSKKVSIVPISPVNKKTLTNSIGVQTENITDIINGISIDEFLISAEEERVPKKIGTAVRLIEKKGVQYLIKAFAEILKEYPETSLEIIGEGEYQEDLKELITQNNLEQSVSIISRLSREEYIHHLQSWDVFVLPSTDESETFGLVAAEAMAAGCKGVITTKCGIAQHLKNNSHIQRVEPANTESLAKGLSAVLEQPESVRQEIQNEAEEKFDILRMYAQYLKLFNASFKSCCISNHSHQKKIHLMFLDQGEHIGGAEFFLSELIAHLNTDEYKTTLISGNPENHKRLYPDTITIIKAEMPSLQIRNPLTLLRYFSVLASLKKIVQQQQPDLLISNTVRTHFIGSQLSKFTSTPLIWLLHDFTFPTLILKYCMKTPSHIFTCSKSVKDWVLEKTRQKYGQKTSVLYPYGADKNHSRTEATKINTIGMVGRIIPWKGQKEFIRAFHLLHKLRPELRAVLVGDTYKNNKESETYYQELLELRKKLKLEKVLEFKKNVSSIYTEISSWKVLIHASLQPEPLGRVILEAMECGTPVVASRKGGGPSEIIKHGENGYLVDPEDEEAMVKYIEQLLSDGTLARMFVQEGRAFIQKNFQWEEKIDKFENVIINLIQEPD
jgi:glycosyltransferase involved in cell wall biosynthesis